MSNAVINPLQVQLTLLATVTPGTLTTPESITNSFAELVKTYALTLDGASYTVTAVKAGKY